MLSPELLEAKRASTSTPGYNLNNLTSKQRGNNEDEGRKQGSKAMVIALGGQVGDRA